MPIPFTKMHGLGNDFVIIEKKFISEFSDLNEFARKISNRSLGVGCDQFIIYQMPESLDGSKNISMEIYNQDGSMALACGNASRCLSHLIFDKTGIKETILKVKNRNVFCKYINSDTIEVDMGMPIFEDKWMPDKNELWKFSERYLIDPKEIICVDVANPHLVIFSNLSNQDQDVIGKNFQETDLFPDGINVNFANVNDDKIFLKTWERGVGFTYACGSGAIATFAAANRLGFADDDVEIVFELGSLYMQKKQNNITMSGKANYVFRGDYIA